MTSTDPTITTSGNVVGTGADRGLHQEGQQSRWSPERRDALRALQNAGDASDGDLDMLEIVSNRTGLDPFIKQIYLVGRKTKTGGYRGEPERWETKWTVQAGIDGFREVSRRYADSRGEGCSISAARFFDQEGREYPFWLKSMGNPTACVVTVKIGDSEGTGVATWDEYVQTTRNGDPNSMWSKMGPTMLAKCAEAQAHRRVCGLTSGMYEPTEISQEPVQATAERVPGPSRGAAGVRERLGIGQMPAPEADTQDALAQAREPEPVEQVASGPAINDLLALLGSVGIEGKEPVLEHLSRELGRELTTTRTLTVGEVERVTEAVIAQTEGGDR